MNVVEKPKARPDSEQDPGYILHCLVVDAMKLFYKLCGEDPKVIHLTGVMEQNIQSFLDKEFEGKVNLRRDHQYLGMTPKFDADSFDLD